jgi:hypothetical protein
MKMEGEYSTKVLGHIFQITQYYITDEYKLDDGGDDYYDYAADSSDKNSNVHSYYNDVSVVTIMVVPAVLRMIDDSH